MHTKLPTLALLAMGSFLSGNSAGAPVPQSYTFTELGILGGRYSAAEAVSNTGEIAGRASLSNLSRSFRATVWDGTTPTELETLGGRSGAYDINNRGEIVGAAALSFRRGETEPQPVLWDGGAKIIPLDTLGAGGSANAINNRGKIAGEVDLPTGGSRAAVWSGTKLTQLDTLGGASGSASDINNRGQVAGASSLPSGYEHAVLWNGTAAIDLGTLGGNSSFAYAINDRGQVVGSSSVNPDDGYLSHATLWNGTEATDLGTLGGPSSFAYSINNAGLVVGESQMPSSTNIYERHATLWANGTAIDLNGLLDAEAVNDGWVLTSANDINDKGWIVGSASNYLQGVALRAFLLTPSNEEGAAITVPMMLTAVPEPETYAMFLAGLGLMAGTLLSRRKTA